MAMVMTVDQMDPAKLVLHESHQTAVNLLDSSEESDNDSKYIVISYIK